MNLSHLSDKELMINTKALVKQESSVLIKILHHIKEIDRRRLYSDYKQPGLLELVMSELGYPRDQALRRMQAMRMMRENPIVEEKIENGELDLTKIGMVQALFSHEKKEGKPLSSKEKLNVIEKVCGKSSREAQKVIFSYSSKPLKLNEKIKMIAPDLYELTAVIDEETTLIIENLKGIIAHSHPNISNGELIKMLGQIGLKELQRVKPLKSKQLKTEIKKNSVAAPRLKSKHAANPNLVEAPNLISENNAIPNLVAAPRPNSKTPSSQIPTTEQTPALKTLAKQNSPQLSKAEIKRQIWQRDQNKCTNCASTFALQEDHRIPKAKGGEYTLQNMRILCRSCNQRAAVKQFGIHKMEKFLISPK